MPRRKKTKNSFNYDSQGRAILGSAKEIAEWVRLGFEEQNKSRRPDEALLKNFIDLRKCVLYVTYPIGSNAPMSRIFNLCDLAGIVPGIEKIDCDPNYLFEVKYDICFDGSELYGNFFHYVKFCGMVRMDDVTVLNTFSCFKCLFEGYVYMQGIHITGGTYYEQCEFKMGLVMSSAIADLFEFNCCTIRERLLLISGKLVNRHNNLFHQYIQIKNSVVENLNFSSVNTNGLPIYIEDSKISKMHMDKVRLNNTLLFKSCRLEGTFTFVRDEEGLINHIKEIVLHDCDLNSQYHIENSNLEKIVINFCNITDKGRVRLSHCSIGDLKVRSSSVFGLMDIIGNKIKSIGLEEISVPGYVNFQHNKVDNYSDRQTLRLLKNEAMKVNDNVAATQLYAKEMEILLSDKNVQVGDKVTLWLNKLFSHFGESWGRAFVVTLVLSLALTFLMLGFGSSKYGFNPMGEFIGLGHFITIMLESVNVFSIPLFGDTVEEYGLNVVGQILYLIIKLVVAYGSYQLIISFRKYGRS